MNVSTIIFVWLVEKFFSVKKVATKITYLSIDGCIIHISQYQHLSLWHLSFLSQWTLNPQQQNYSSQTHSSYLIPIWIGHHPIWHLRNVIQWDSSFLDYFGISIAIRDFGFVLQRMWAFRGFRIGSIFRAWCTAWYYRWYEYPDWYDFEIDLDSQMDSVLKIILILIKIILFCHHKNFT